MNRKCLWISAAAVCVLGLTAASGARYFIKMPQPVLKSNLVVVPPGTGVDGISRAFFKNDPPAGWAFKSYVWLTGRSRRLRAGEYEVRNDSIESLVGKLVEGKVHVYRLTFREGIWARDMAALLDASGLGRGETYLALLSDTAFIQELLGYPAPSLEGYLFPETYFFTKGMSESDILRTLVSKFKEKVQPLVRDMKDLTLHEAVTLASIVEREAALDEERPRIAGVFRNRLKKRMQLESCVTVEYALGRKKKILTDRDLLVESPYNTYRHYGLPPGPVCSPGLDSLRAVVSPEVSPYLFFVAQGDGRHVFSTTWSAHRQAKKKLERSKRGP